MKLYLSITLLSSISNLKLIAISSIKIKFNIDGGKNKTSKTAVVL